MIIALEAVDGQERECVVCVTSRARSFRGFRKRVFNLRAVYIAPLEAQRDGSERCVCECAVREGFLSYAVRLTDLSPDSYGLLKLTTSWHVRCSVAFALSASLSGCEL